MKRIIALLLCTFVLFGLSACGGGDTPTDTDSALSGGSDTGSSDSSASSSDSPEEEWEPVHVVDNLVMGNDGEKLNVYDLDSVEPGRTLDDAVIWSTKYGLGGDMKYREDTAFGDVIVTCGSGGANMISYPEGKVLWSTSNAGNNPHAIEILPGGNIVVASSTGNTLRLFYVSALQDGDADLAKTFKEYELIDAHGVLYDPEYGCLWGLGGTELVAYLLSGEGTSQTLRELGGEGGKLPQEKQGGHDLSPDYSDTRYLYLTVNACVYRFDKETGEFDEKFPQYAKLNKNSVKGFSNNPNGNFFLTQVNNGIGTSWENEEFASWCTDRITYGYWKSEHFLYITEYISETGHFYKSRVFCGQYQ